MKKTFYQYIFLSIAALFCLSSCITHKQIAYFQNGIDQRDTIAVSQLYVPKIQPGDILSIPIGSLNPLASSFFNPYSTMAVPSESSTVSSGFNGGKSPSSNGGNGSQGAAALTEQAAPGYLVDAAGTVEIPIIGSIKLAGLTTSQARDTIKKHLQAYLKEPTVNVRFLNYKVSVMGEVMHPSVYVIPNETVTLPEALSLAGDMTIFGRRDNVMIIRDVNGKKEFGRVNLNSRDLFKSPYYYLH
ncbi:MAG TPA: polysaccharide biosynthesis/export family protein, partial [Mucilaginibacter sp.]|nr:polysaccharide biosynthesis/export family protein [Mucilaginibacter sp.]